jgi:putative transposase
VLDPTIDGLSWVRKQVEQADTDLLREMVKLFCERVMGEEADAICGRPFGERSDERTNRRKGSPEQGLGHADRRDRAFRPEAS